MPFPQDVKEQALVDAARHCCVCHRFKGVKVQVHHIVPEAQGGSNEIENAIALCFDCHADAGHYNPKHPIGTKLSPSELRRHRDRWHDIVCQNAIPPPDEPDLFYCRYLLCKSFDAFREITLGDVSHLPADKPFLVSNPVGDFHRTIADRHHDIYRHDHVWGDDLVNREAYARTHPELQLRRQGDIEHYPYFEAVRVPSIAELRERVATKDSITNMLVDSGTPPGEIAVALAYVEPCGASGFQEIYRIRPMWALYLAATNLSGRLLHLSCIECEQETPSALGYRSYGLARPQASVLCPLPSAPLPPGATLVIPLATLLGPLAEIVPTTLSETSEYVPGDPGHVVAHQDMENVRNLTSLIGPALWPRSLHLSSTSRTLVQPFHEFDLKNLYTISRDWRCGSCPHLFVLQAEPDSLHYVGELFGRQAGIVQGERFIVPDDICGLVVAELEEERTVIAELKVNGVVRILETQLDKGDFLRVAVDANDVVDIVGCYNSVHEARAEPWFRNCIIEDFICCRSL